MRRQTRMSGLSLRLGAVASLALIYVISFYSAPANAQAAAQARADGSDQFEVVSIKEVDPAVIAAPRRRRARTMSCALRDAATRPASLGFGP